jgi:hypothetical protein
VRRRGMFRAVGIAAGIVATGWIASALPYGPAGAWAALTLFPGWFVYTVASQHPVSESLNAAGRLAVSVGSLIFWAALVGGALALRSRVGQR